MRLQFYPTITTVLQALFHTDYSKSVRSPMAKQALLTSWLWCVGSYPETKNYQTPTYNSWLRRRLLKGSFGREAQFGWISHLDTVVVKYHG